MRYIYDQDDSLVSLTELSDDEVATIFFSLGEIAHTSRSEENRKRAFDLYIELRRAMDKRDE